MARVAVLPDDIIYAIAQQLKRHGNNVDLRSFILVCKHWCKIGRPVFYSHIGLNTTTLSLLLNAFPFATHGRHTKSVTLDLNRPQEEHPDACLWAAFDTTSPERKQEILEIEAALPTVLESFAHKLESFQNLSSFSLHVARYGKRAVPRSTIIKLIQNLTESCLHLEIDTSATDYCATDEDAHVCDAVRQILPRLHNVRICLGAMCSVIFGSIQQQHRNAVVSSEAPTRDVATLLPNMRSMLLVCGKSSLAAAYDCRDDIRVSGGRSIQFPDDHTAYKAIVRDLTSLTGPQAFFRENASIYVTVEAPPGGMDDYTCRSKLRVDVVKRQTWASPVIDIDRKMNDKISKHFLVRTPEAEVVTPSDRTIDDITEGALWANVTGGIRLPAETLQTVTRGFPSIATECCEETTPSMSLEKWLADNPPSIYKGNTAWSNEIQSGEKLVLPEIRSSKNYLAVIPIEQKAPQGWRRIRGGLERN